MLLCYMILFLNFTMVIADKAQKRYHRLTKGWDNHEYGPKLGCIYWIVPSELVS